MARRIAWLAAAGTVALAGCIPAAPNPYASRPTDTQAYDPPPRAQAIPPAPVAAQTPRPARRTPDRPIRTVDPDDTKPIGPGVAALPAPAPAWEARPVTLDARDVPAGTYTVAAGDTLRGIAAKTGASAEAIAKANGLASPFVVQRGQQLRIPAGRYHLVHQGETGIAIARAYGVEWSQIVAANDLSEPYILRTGQRILIPGYEPGARPRSVAERAAAFQLDVDDILTGGEPALAANQEVAKPTATPRRVLPSTAVVVEPDRRTSGFMWPVAGKVVGGFGPGRSGERNDGLKIAVPLDTPVKASADGVVAYVGDGVAALGGLVILKHGDGWVTVYGHMSELLVQRGQKVKRGQVIGKSGDSGFADRPELHFEMRRGRTPVDPLSQLPKS